MKFKKSLSIGILSVLAVVSVLTLTSMKKDTKVTNAYLEISLDIKSENRVKAAGVYLKYKQPFLQQVAGATSKELLLRTEDVQVIHGFESEAEAQAYLTTKLFENDVVRELKPYLASSPEIRVYSVFRK